MKRLTLKSLLTGVVFASFGAVGVVAPASADGAAGSRKVPAAKAAPDLVAEEREMLERAQRESPLTARQKETNAQRAEELARLSDKLKKAREQRPEVVQAGASSLPSMTLPDFWPTEVKRAPLEGEKRSGLGMGDRPAPGATKAAATATVLIVMAPGTSGMRRGNPTADPVLCTDDGCYISTGAASPATLRTWQGALGAANTLGDRAGACRNQTGCIFRNVELSAGAAMVQPVDMRMVRHDRRERQVVALDDTCRVKREILICDNPVDANGYTLWVVPEAVAIKAGSAGLQAAIDAGLPVR